MVKEASTVKVGAVVSLEQCHTTVPALVPLKTGVQERGHTPITQEECDYLKQGSIRVYM